MTNELPETVRRAATIAARKNKDDVKKAIVDAEARVRKSPQFKSVVDLLLNRAISNLVYEIRSQDNLSLRRQAGDLAQGKPRLFNSEVVDDIYGEYLSYSVAGKSLGVLTGAELEPIAESEERQASGHLFNASLLRTLRKLVKDDQHVADVVSNAKLKAMFKTLGYEKDGTRKMA